MMGEVVGKRCQCGERMVSLVTVQGYKCRKCSLYWLLDPLDGEFVWLRQVGKAVQPPPASRQVLLPDILEVNVWLTKELKRYPEVVTLILRQQLGIMDHGEVVTKTDYPVKVALILGDFCKALQAGLWAPESTDSAPCSKPEGAHPV